MVEDLEKLISLKGKVAVVTGAASGIGFGIAKRLAEADAAVALLDINEERGYTSERELKKSGYRAKFYRCDVTSNEQCAEVAE